LKFKDQSFIIIDMVVGYVIGAILIAFGVAVLYKTFSGFSTDLQIVYYPFLGISLLVMGAWVCYGYASGNSKKLELDSNSNQ